MKVKLSPGIYFTGLSDNGTPMITITGKKRLKQLDEARKEGDRIIDVLSNWKPGK